MADRLDVLLGILLDKAAQKDVERGLSSIEAALGKLDDAQFQQLDQELERMERGTRELEQQFAQARQEAERLNTVSEKLTRNSAMLFAAGAAIVGGAALAVQNYVKFVEDAGIQGDETADKWIAASKRVKNAQLNLGQEAAQALLPVYEKLATLAEKVASFANANPELVQAGINTGLVVATIGAIGLAVSKGIRLVADFKYLAATAEFTTSTIRFQNSVREYLSKTLLPNAPAGTGGGLVVAGKAGKAIGTITLLASAVIIGAEAGAALGNALGKLVYGDDYKKQGVGDAALTATRIGQLPALLGSQGLQALGGNFEKLGAFVENTIAKNDRFMQNLLGISDAADAASESTDQLADGLRDFQQEADMAQATTAYIQYRQQEAQAEEQYMQQRSQIVEQGAAQLAQIEANYAQQRSQLAQQFAASSAQALDNFRYQQAQAAEQFNRGEAQAAQQYQEQRQQAQQDARKAELQAEEDHQREMQRLAEDSQDRQRDLIAARDALGLVRERRDLARQQRQAEEDFNAERQRRRQENRQRLQDMEEQFQNERAKRREEFAYQQAQALEQFERQQEQARQQYEERLKQLAEQHQQELARTRQQTAERLRELELQYRQEQITRRNAFYDILRDLNANLLGEQQTRQQYYARMQADLERFLASSSMVPRGSNLPGYASGGYTPDGAIRAHQGEWVADRETTRALERSIGGRLTQDGVRSLTNRSESTVNLSFPGGLVTTKMLGDVLEQNNAQFLRKITKGLVR